MITEKVSRVSRILREHWDPIGCGVPDDEYVSYAEKLCNLDPGYLVPIAIAYKLSSWAYYDMRCPVPKEKSLAVAELVLKVLTGTPPEPPHNPASGPLQSADSRRTDR